jgi:hypothetical protein
MKIYPLIFLFFSSQLSFGQCGNQDEIIFITSQEDLNSLSTCELFYGSLNITGEGISSILPLANISSISGSLSIYDTSIESIEPLANMMSAS